MWPTPGVCPLSSKPGERICGASGSKVKYLANGDTRITLPLQYCVNFGLHCVLKCTRTLSASIAKESAEKLVLKSGNLGTVKTSFGEEWNYRYPLSTKVRRAFRRITRNGGQITVNFRAKAVGPNDQVFKKRTSIHERAFANRGDWIRTSDRSAPSRVRYQTAPRPVTDLSLGHFRPLRERTSVRNERAPAMRSVWRAQTAR